MSAPANDKIRLAAVEALAAQGKLSTAIVAGPSLASLIAEPRKDARDDFFASLRHLRERMREILAVDDSHAPAGVLPQFLSSAMGAETDVFFDTGALAQALHRPASKAAKRMDPVRRQRIESSLSVLVEFLDAEDPPYQVVPVNGVPEAAQLVLDRFTRLLRAIRTARLESENAFDPAIHPERLARLQWRSATAGELLAMPMVIGVGEASETSLSALSEALKAGLPVQYLLLRRGIGVDLGYIAVAHRECFVMESSVVCEDHLTTGLRAMGETVRPAVAIISTDPLLYFSRAYPTYVYNPDKGDTWAQRLAWQAADPVEVRFLGKSETITPAHAAWHGHLTPVPPDGWSDHQIPLSDYLDRFLDQVKDQPSKAVPYLWLLDAAGQPQRATVSRELTMICRDRRLAWRFFEELAGIGNSHVEAALAAARKEMDQQLAAREAAAAESGKTEGAAIAVRRVVAVLTSSSRPSPPGKSAAPKPVPPPAVAAPPAAQAAASTPQVVVEAAADPYIDSFLCTSCNDCMKVNPRMFQYNAEKQAYLADASAGTYAELVKAAEGCPAHCIHVGMPRPGDATATTAVLAKAAKLR